MIAYHRGSIAKLLAAAKEADAQDPLASFRSRFVFRDPRLIYLDGNSLGRMPAGSGELVGTVVTQQWGGSLIESWKGWAELPYLAGDVLASEVLGAMPGEVLVADSTTVNLYKLALAALEMGGSRRRVLIEEDNFPTDHYILSGLVKNFGVEVEIIPSHIDEGTSLCDLEQAFSEEVSFAVISMVSYRSGAKVDLRAANAIASKVGSRVIWDLSHAAGATLVDLGATGCELGIGCTYKYLNAGPGSPAYLYVRGDLLEALESPIRGWFSQANQFEMGLGYVPRQDIGRFGAGTPNIVGTKLVLQGASLVGEAGITALASKGSQLGDFFISAAEEFLGAYGFEIASPRNSSGRGAHVSLYHPLAREVTRALIDEARVVPDFRTPDRIRFGFSPLYTSYTDLAEAVARIVELAELGRFNGIS